MNTTSKAGNWKKSPGIAGNGPQIDEAGKMSNASRKSKVAPEVAKRRFLTVLRRV